MQRMRLVQLQGWLLSAGCIAYVLYLIDWVELATVLPRISVIDIFALSAIYLSGFLVRGFRWQILLPGLGIKTATSGVVLGYAANNVLPARLGELVRAQIVGRHAGISRSTTLATVLLERVFDGFVIVLLLIAATGGLDLPQWAESLRLLGLILFSSLLLCSWIAGRWGEFFLQFVPKGKIHSLASGLMEGTALGTRSINVWLLILTSSALVWIIEGSMFFYAFSALDMPLTWMNAYFVLGVINLGILIPNSPGNIGVFQYFTVLALGLFGISATEATAYSLLVHICQFIPITLTGFFLLPSFGFSSFRNLSTGARKKSANA